MVAVLAVGNMLPGALGSDPWWSLGRGGSHALQTILFLVARQTAPAGTRR